MSWSDVTWDWSGYPVPAPRQPLRDLVLAALAEAFITRRVCAGPAFCADCRPGDLCADHREDLARAREYEGVYMRIRGIGSDGAVLELIGGLTP